MQGKLKSVMEKVAKLRALAERATTQAEAETAAAQAEALVSKYQLDEAQIEAAGEVVAEAIGEDEPLWSGARVTTWLGVLANGLSKGHGCACVVQRGQGPIVFRIAGRPSDVAIVRYLFAWLHVEIARMSRAERGRAAQNAFRIGAAQGVLNAMRGARAVETDGVRSSVAMVLISRADESLAHLKAKIGVRFTKSKSSYTDTDALKRGYAAGGNLNTRPALGGGGVPLLPEHS